MGSRRVSAQVTSCFYCFESFTCAPVALQTPQDSYSVSTFSLFRNKKTHSLLIIFFHNYRPQTKFAKFMFLHVSVSHSVHRGGSGPLHAGIHHPNHPPPPGSGIPLGPGPPGPDTPHAVHAGRYGQQAGGMHPTGIQSCCLYFCQHGVAFTETVIVVVELFGPGWRTFMSYVYQAWVAVGILLLGGIAYFIRDFVFLQYVLIIPGILCITYIWYYFPIFILFDGRYKILIFVTNLN